MENVTIQLPAALALQIKHNGTQTLDLSKMGPDWFLWAIANGVRQSAGDADAGMGDESPETRAAAVLAKFQRIAEGEVPSTGGGGARLTFEEKAWRNILKARLVKTGMKATDAAKVAKGPREAAIAAIFEALIAAKYGKAAVTAELVQDAWERNRAVFEADVAREAAELEAEAKRKAALEAGMSGLDFDGLDV